MSGERSRTAVRLVGRVAQRDQLRATDELTRPFVMLSQLLRGRELAPGIQLTAIAAGRPVEVDPFFDDDGREALAHNVAPRALVTASVSVSNPLDLRDVRTRVELHLTADVLHCPTNDLSPRSPINSASTAFSPLLRPTSGRPSPCSPTCFRQPNALPARARPDLERPPS